VGERARDVRRQTGRRRGREIAAIATALLIVPAAAVVGLKLPLDASGVLAPIFDLPRSAFGHVHSSDDGKVQLADPPPTEVRFARGDDTPFLPPARPPRHHDHGVGPHVAPALDGNGNDGAGTQTPVSPDADPAEGSHDRPSTRGDHETPPGPTKPADPPKTSASGGDGTSRAGSPGGQSAPGSTDAGTAPSTPTADEPESDPSVPSTDDDGGPGTAPLADTDSIERDGPPAALE